MRRSLLLLSLALCTTFAQAQYAPQFGSAVAVAGSDVAVGEGRNLLLPGSAFVFSPDADGRYELTATLTAGGEAADGFGRALAGQDDFLVVGAPEASRVYIFQRSGHDWTRVGLIDSTEPRFGHTVAHADGHVFVGGGGERGQPGTVSAFRATDDMNWVPTGEWQAPEPEANDGFGSAISVRGGRAAIGAPGSNERRGVVQTLEFDGSAWQDTGVLRHTDPREGDGFGSSVNVIHHFVTVGVPGRDARSGSVLGFRRAAGDAEWSLTSKMSPFDVVSGESFGQAVAFGGNQVLVGAPGAGAREGALFLFTPNGQTERMDGIRIERPGPVQFRSGFGGSMAAEGDVMVVGAPGQDNFEGAAFVYSGDWSEPQMIWHDSGKFASRTGEAAECEDEDAGGFSCSEVDMLSFLTREDVGARRGVQMSDVWGWEDPETGREYALIGRTDGTSFVDLTDPHNPVFLGNLQKTDTANPSLWRDVKVYRDHAFIVADGAGAHHVQIFDLRQLRDVSSPPVQFTETAIYKGVFSSHNIVINEESGFAYAVGSDSGGESCGGALHMIDIRDPASPTFAGCFADRRTGRGGSGATHDAQCVMYRGPDQDYQGREICLSSNGTALSIADVTDKDSPVAISIADYPNVAYTHQGWLDEEHRYFYLNDEGDEVSELVDATRTLIFDLTDLDDPVLSGEYFADNSAIDHNLYIKGNLMYQTNYQAGLRIIDITDRERPVEVGYFDTVPYGPNDNSPVLGAWSNYPYFKSGVIVVTSGREGVFFLKRKTIDT